MTASVLKQDPNTKRLLIYFNTETQFCGLIKGISPKICILCVRAKINKCLLEPFCVWILSSLVKSERPLVPTCGIDCWNGWNGSVLADFLLEQCPEFPLRESPK